jgi:hypothetical protein
MTQRLTALTRGGGKWRLLVCLAALALAANGLLVSRANLGTQTSNPISTASGILRMANPDAGTAILSASGLRPGDTRSATLSITNNGSVGGSYQLSASDLTDTPSSPALSQTLDLSIDDITGGSPSNVYDGTLGSFSQSSLGSFGAGASRTYRFTLSWPSASTDPALQGAQTSLTFDWRATS